jgi:predicted pyridoxine 5'-phosphate oxidase superfamily flavin-nucleotide-binding protein
MIVLGGDDHSGRIWASVLFGPPDFLFSSDATELRIDLARSSFRHADPLWDGLQRRAIAGALIIDLESRRRLRVNGIVAERDDVRLSLAVTESYANCPKYIQRRLLHVGQDAPAFVTESVEEGSELGPAGRAAIEAADTLFVASRHRGHGADVSHRGGYPGFVQVLDGRTLRVPDYRGNSLFNTLGNFAVDPAAGLLFLGFETGLNLHLTGRAELLWDSKQPGPETGGTGRYWEFRIERWRSIPVDPRLGWTFLDSSPFNPCSTSEAQDRH